MINNAIQKLSIMMMIIIISSAVSPDVTYIQALVLTKTVWQTHPTFKKPNLIWNQIKTHKRLKMNAF